MKSFRLLLLPLSMLVFSACDMKYVLVGTPIAPQKLTQKRLLIITHDTETTQTFLISLKNYLSRDLQARRVEVKNVNMRKNDMERSLSDLKKLQIEFRPDFLLTVRVGTERSWKFYTVQARKKFKMQVENIDGRLRDASLDLELVPNTEGGSHTPIWSGQLALKYLFQSEQITDVKKIVKTLGQTMQKDGLVE